MKKFIVVVTGPTATGKSDFAEKLAQKLGGEIINADIGSWYAPLNIGTAKPNLNTMSIAYHLFNILNKPEQFTVVAFRNRVEQLTEEIWSRGKIPVIVGGSAFYIKALWYKSQESGSSSEIEHVLMKSTQSTQDLWRQLFEIDQFRAEKINNNDRYRVVRALGIYTATGQKPSSFNPVYDPIAPIFGFFCYRERQELYDRINYRTELMLQNGWIEEVQNIMGTEWEKFLIEKKIIGYDDIIHYLRSGKTSLLYDNLVTTIQQKTRNYAKRQITFLSKLKRDIMNDTDKSSYTMYIQEIDLMAQEINQVVQDLYRIIMA
ncbi:tRNA (adenosine(37)-N6)-dimethylallyltransferase MiaA [Candidatus Dependentiae bacterium]|nr:tRNA (adenosine(37)-N6)-dimethylallyltransferase MiaA [Candidatus Dependentiae bacterium]